MNKKENQELKRRMKAWVFDHANEMIEELNMERSAAFRQAYLVYDLLEKLGEGIVAFEYKKKDGTLRRALGTLCKGVSAKYDAYEYKDKEKRDCYPRLEYAYWDLDREAYRSFSMERVVRIIGVSIPNKREQTKNHDLIEFV